MASPSVRAKAGFDALFTIATGPTATGTPADGISFTVNGTMIAYNATNPYTNSATIPVEVHYTAATGVTVKFNGTTIFTNTAVPAFTLQSGDRYGFGGRTGGLNEVNVVDNVTIAPR